MTPAPYGHAGRCGACGKDYSGDTALAVANQIAACHGHRSYRVTGTAYTTGAPVVNRAVAPRFPLFDGRPAAVALNQDWGTDDAR